MAGAAGQVALAQRYQRQPGSAIGRGAGFQGERRADDTAGGPGVVPAHRGRFLLVPPAGPGRQCGAAPVFGPRHDVPGRFGEAGDVQVRHGRGDHARTAPARLPSGDVAPVAEGVDGPRTAARVRSKTCP
ncbi:hypothetical protein [Streptomyces sp. XY152]|uniref:hypothetical protein n=1 Tax=Streptomyces sp. XY152 TaxID=1415560 RepID=UPI0007C8240B|nr:hypothetical protein [Streptomyces sp. XY152]